MTGFIIALMALVAIGPLSIYAFRLGRKHRRMSFAATSLLLLFGVNFNVTPPPPATIESVVREEKEAENDEPE
ncbi:MAG: hypothetical protein JWM33_1461 [Caulobacteraceae bacterium]|nr:hypothetical protein [Caulobacteraceae bacterium]